MHVPDRDLQRTEQVRMQDRIVKHRYLGEKRHCGIWLFLTFEHLQLLLLCLPTDALKSASLLRSHPVLRAQRYIL